MHNKIVVSLLTIFLLASAPLPEAGQAKFYRVGVILQGGPYYEAINGLRDGLREVGLEEGKHFVLDIRDAQGDLHVVEEAARQLERAKVNLLYTVATSVTLAAKRATVDIPIVFYSGTDPVALGLIEIFAKPGRRLTGVPTLTTDLPAKRLEMLKEILPEGCRVLTFYNPSNRSAGEAAKAGREAARQLGVEFVERHVASVEELQAALGALRAGEVDAYFFVSDGMVVSQAQRIIDTARAQRVATMCHEGSLVAQGGLASYGMSYYRAGHASAQYIQRILAGTNPKDLPVETVNKLDLVLNLLTARQIGLTVPLSVLYQADKVIK